MASSSEIPVTIPEKPTVATPVQPTEPEDRTGCGETETLRKLESSDPRYANGTLQTKLMAEEIDLNHLEHSNLYLTYKGNEQTEHHKLKYNLRSSFNNSEHGLNFWFMDAYAKIKAKQSGGAWSARAILNPNAYFMLAYRQKFAQQMALKFGVETEVGQTPRHFLKLSKGFNDLKLTAMFSGELSKPKENQLNLLDTVSLIPSYKFKFADPASKLKKVKVGLGIDFDIRNKTLAQKRDVKLRSSVNYRDGAFWGEFDLGKTVNSDISLFHNVNSSFGLYAGYKGSLRTFDGLKTFGFQVKVPDFGKIRTALDSKLMLKNTFIFRAHPFASIVQFTQFNVKDRSNLHFGLGLALGN